MSEDTLTAGVVDRFGDAVESCDAQFRDYGGRARFHGVVSTLRCWHDNALLKSVVHTPGRQRVLVVDGGGSLHSALIGDVIASAAMDNGWAGLIIYGAVRDVAALRTLDLGIRAMGSNPRKSSKAGSGERDVPIWVGGLEFRPGLVVIVDEDGLVVGPAGLLSPDPR